MLIGRLAAQWASSKYTRFVTLTYRDNDDGSTPYNATELIRSDAELFRKRMKNNFDPFQYLIVGEYGERKGRAHWHGLLYFEENSNFPLWFLVPDYVDWSYKMAKMRYQIAPAGSTVKHGDTIVDAAGSFPVTVTHGDKSQTFTVFPPSRTSKSGPPRFRVLVPEWPHGHMDICIPNSGAFAYVAKYVLKSEDAKVLNHNGSTSLAPQEDEDGKRINYFLRSRNLGMDFIRSEGKRSAAKGIEPKDSTYRVSGIKYQRGPKAGKYKQFIMTRAQRREYLRAYLREFARLLIAGKRKSFEAKGEFLQAFLNADAAADPVFAAQQFSTALASRFTFQSARSRVQIALGQQKIAALPPAERDTLRDASVPLAVRRFFLPVVGQIVATVYRDATFDLREVGPAGDGVFPWLLSRLGHVERQFDALPFRVPPQTRSEILGLVDDALASFEAAGLSAVPRALEECRNGFSGALEANRKACDAVTGRWGAPPVPLPTHLGGDIPPRSYGLPDQWSKADFTPADEKQFPLWCFFMKEAMASVGGSP